MMDRDQRTNICDVYLDEVVDQISYKPIRASIRLELQEHLQDRIEDYETQGISGDEAERKAIYDMGDAVQVGVSLNEVHHVQTITFPQIGVIGLLTIGFLLSNFMQWSPEQVDNGMWYYLFGIPFFALVSWYGNPFFIKHRRTCTLILTVGLVLATLMSRYLLMVRGIPSIRYCLVLFSMMLITVGLYELQYGTSRKQIAGILFGGIITVALVCTSIYIETTVKAIFILSVWGTVFFMIHKNTLPGKKYKLYLIAGAGLVLSGLILCLDSNQSLRMKSFLKPETVVQSTWDDAYNGILIRELLTRTPLVGGLELSHDELLDYGTGAWYFAERDERQIGLVIPENETEEERLIRKEYAEKLREEKILIRYFYDSSELEIWDILPQHYHNNYIFAVVMFMFGKIPGILLLVTVSVFFYLLASCVYKTQGSLAKCLSFCYFQCLFWQSLFYILGNFGYQYGTFPSMPMLSEGRLSIFLNLFMIGMILSAYRYDRVLENSDINLVKLPS